MRIPQQNFTFFVLVTIICSIFTGTLSSPTYAAEKYEPQQVLKASDILPKTFFESEMYKVGQSFLTNGLLKTIIIAAALLIGYCSHSFASDQEADVIYTGGDIITINDLQPSA